MTAKLIAATVAVTTIALTLPASATSLKEIERREQAQADAIKAGRKDGSLTFVESYRLKREQKRIDDSAPLLADGKLTEGEVKAIKAGGRRRPSYLCREARPADARLVLAPLQSLIPIEPLLHCITPPCCLTWPPSRVAFFFAQALARKWGKTEFHQRVL